MNPEKLKVIAEGMGYETISLFNGEFSCQCGDENNNYNPLKNNDLMVEIMEKLLDLGWVISKFEDKYLLTLEVVCNVSTQFTGKTIAEAVCITYYEVVKGLKK